MVDTGAERESVYRIVSKFGLHLYFFIPTLASNATVKTSAFLYDALDLTPEKANPDGKRLSPVRNHPNSPISALRRRLEPSVHMWLALNTDVPVWWFSSSTVTVTVIL